MSFLNHLLGLAELENASCNNFALLARNVLVLVFGGYGKLAHLVINPKHITVLMSIKCDKILSTNFQRRN